MTLHCQTLGMAPSFGFGDRTGLATPGHVAAMHQAGHGISPIFPQQSIREMSRTGRTPTEVMDDALRGATEAGWHGAVGADADHLKTEADVDVTAAAGFTFFTIDPSGSVDPKADHYAGDELSKRFAATGDAGAWTLGYVGRSVRLATGTTVAFDEATCRRAGVKYGAAVLRTIELGRYIAKVQEAAGRPYEIELSVDETDQPTTLAEHFMIAEQVLKAGVKMVSLAPRFIGDFEKGVDFKGDRDALAHSLRDHAAISDALGPYKLSLHSGSDKLSMYPALAAATRGHFHVKTAGTSYLEALRVVARHEPAEFRRIVDFARERYDTDKATYHVSAVLSQVPAPADVDQDSQLQRLYLEHWAEVLPGHGFTAPGRQILHCTFGSVLTNPEFGPLVKQILRDHQATYTEVLREHFVKHLEALNEGLAGVSR